MKVSVIIPNYNGKEYIKECLEALEKQTFTDFETIFVDNGSLDGSRNYIREHYPDINFTPLDKNYGFSGAVNVGIRESKGDYVVLLNNDTQVDPDWLRQLVLCMDQDEMIFSCSSKMIRYHERDLIDDAGDQYCALGWARKRGDGQPANLALYNEDKQIFSACAGAAIYRKSVLKKIGLFDENFFAYLEDVDIGYRGNIYGYKNIYCSKALVYHIGSATTGATRHNAFKVKLAARNNIYLIYKNMPPLQRGLNMPFLLVGRLIKYIYFARKGFGKEFREGIKEGKRTKKDLTCIDYNKKHLKHYLQIQGMLIRNLLGYLFSSFC